MISDQTIIPALAPGVSAFYFPEVSTSKFGLLITPVTNTVGYGDIVNKLVQEGKIGGFAGVDPTIFFLSILHRMPLYRFEPEGGGFTYPYKKIKKPNKVLNINDISMDFPFIMEKLKLTFNETDRIQLMEIGFKYDDINTWNNGGWVALDGKVYGFDGKFLGLEKDL